MYILGKCTNFKYMESSGKPIFEACFEDLPPHPTGAIVWDTSMLNPDGTEAFNQFIEKDNVRLLYCYSIYYFFSSV